MTALEIQGAKAKAAARVLATATTAQKNAALQAIAAALETRQAEIIAANEIDMAAARESGMRQSLQDRLLLDAKRKLIRYERVATGTLTRLLVHPRNVFGPALQYHAAKIIIVHNHPSGDVTPSKLDDELTAALKQAADVLCVPLMDHVILGAPTAVNPRPYFSYAEAHKL